MEIIIRLRTTFGIPILKAGVTTAAKIIIATVYVMIIALIIPHEYIQIIKILRIIGIIK